MHLASANRNDSASASRARARYPNRPESQARNMKILVISRVRAFTGPQLKCFVRTTALAEINKNDLE